MDFRQGSARPTAPAPLTQEEAAALRQRLVQLDGETRLLFERLAQAEDGVTLPGVHLELETGGLRALVPVGRVAELVHLIALTPVPDAAPGVLGAFVARGEPHVAIDLAALLGVEHRPALDAILVLLQGSARAALVVDRAHALAEEPILSRRSLDDEEGLRWSHSGLVAAWCVVGGRLLPLLDVDRIVLRLEVTP
ncbi:MAG: chemotaxis protein CheW [Archangium sp.]|nr:chemotaxis protein CheW [Archangium sp.]MDP3156086.1 chemotaxis protein CheW [Archangium sp.]MDP3572844.1 chemotaxis protein CheW [Archangium sp.]